MDKLYWGAVVIFAIGWYIEQRMYVDGYTRRKRDPYKPIDYLGMFSIGEFVGYLIRCLIAPAFVWFPDILIGLPDNLIQAIAAVWLVVMSIFVPAVVERVIDGFLFNLLQRFNKNLKCTRSPIKRPVGVCILWPYRVYTSFTVTSLSIVVLSISAAWSAIVQDTAVSGFAAERLSQPAHPYHTYRGSQHSVAVQ